jgi:predicted nuclease of predicted toxin-antitoxin system
MTLSFLADENISPESADFLETLGYPCRSILRNGPRRLTDPEIVALAKQEERVILTHDVDFGGSWSSFLRPPTGSIEALVASSDRPHG